MHLLCILLHLRIEPSGEVSKLTHHLHLGLQGAVHLHATLSTDAQSQVLTVIEQSATTQFVVIDDLRA